MRPRPSRWAGVTLAATLASCGGGEQTVGGRGGEPGGGEEAVGGEPEIFAEVAEAMGLGFVHDPEAAGEYRLPEGVGSGVALLDYDDDGDPDLYFVQGGPLGGETAAGATAADGPAAPESASPRNRLYRNDGGTRFTDVSAGSGADIGGYGMGVAAADYDADGDVDLYVTRLGPNALLRNDGGVFADVTAAAGVGDPGFGTGAAFLDYDRDGRLDLYVANYVDWSPSREHACYDPVGIRDYCGPLEYGAPLADRLYRGVGGGRFEDVTDAAGIAAERGNGLGVLCTDFDGDGWVDVFVANDQTPCFLWINQGDGTFLEDGTIRGCAFSADGMAIAGMGVTSEDIDGDGDFDLIVANIRDQSHLCLRNDEGFFADVSHAWGFGAWSVPHTGFGIDLFDQDHDGELDGFVANGAVNRWAEPFRSDNPFAEPNQFFRRDATGRFVDRSFEAAVALAVADMSRGLARGDIDGDGDLDLVVTNNRGPVRLLRNDNRSGLAWTILDLDPAGGARHAINARAEVHAGGRRFLTELRPNASYLSSHEPVVHLGLGSATRIDTLRIAWPDGARETWTALPVRERLRLRQGEAPGFDRVSPGVPGPPGRS